VAVVVVCSILLVTALVAGVIWNGRDFRSPDALADLSASEIARRYVWYVAIALVAGVAAGIPIIGAGGRLAMRLLAVTAGSDAQGRTTEADEIVGRITVEGTIGFIVFNGILGGIATAALYLVVRRLLPSGRLAGAAFGLGLLVVLGTTIDPLRRSNPDFDLVGPGWLAVVVFTALALAHGLVLAAIVARLSAWLPLPSTRPRVLARYAVPAVLAAVGFSVIAVAAAIGLVTVAATRWRRVIAAARSPRTVLAGRIGLIGLTLATLPQSAGSVIDIATR
jgi:hypothetical protein